MFDKILIANRGEIAVRIIRACKELGIRTLAVYSEADADSLHVQLADEAICIGKAPSAESYLKIDRIISAAEVGDVEAIHPGYGFLAENAHFAEVCENCNIKFIGPPSSAIRAMGDKVAARETARKAGVSIVPGSDGPIDKESDALKVARKIGYPVIIKAAGGGGGRGMRIAHNDPSLVKAFHTARSEAERAFANASVYLEKYIENPRHIEFQILADRKGKVLHLGERDCSLQRRHQKLLEESPSPALTNDLRKKMGKAAIKVAESVGYINAGTIEMLLDASGDFYFIEMNTRIQVEHPVTEEVTGIDIVKEQIRIAAGEELGYDQKAIEPLKHAIECRINAEDPFNNFQSCPGRIEFLITPGGHGVRVDTHVYAGYTISSHYDSMIAKLICYGRDRRTAMDRMARALDEFLIRGIKTTIPLHKLILKDPNFRRGRYSTAFIDRLLAASQPLVPAKPEESSLKSQAA
ncbi:MAG TPA: acetyl-CoA carboxylase biotin carboxylase subunit [Verrucomicrobiae bacterium]|nr:acetyl-CoA carboxylase biotin carboxylase subunit [Verrucomicrobiae bacterium]